MRDVRFRGERVWDGGISMRGVDIGAGVRLMRISLVWFGLQDGLLALWILCGGVFWGDAVGGLYLAGKGASFHLASRGGPCKSR